jgi:alpha-galactosidase
MKAVSLLIILGGLLVQGTPYTGTVRIISHHASKDFVPDGDLDKAVWKNASRARLGNNADPGKPEPDAATEVAAAWTESSLYFAFWNTFTVLNTYEGEDPKIERWQLWDRDVVEVFINPFPERLNLYWEFEVAPNNQWVDLEINLDRRAAGKMSNAGWNSGFLHATRVDPASRRWYCEMRIPTGPMGVSRIRAGSEWRINFYRADGPGSDDRRRFLSWSPTLDGSFHKPERFGLIRFEK